MEAINWEERYSILADLAVQRNSIRGYFGRIVLLLRYSRWHNSMVWKTRISGICDFRLCGS